MVERCPAADGETRVVVLIVLCSSSLSFVRSRSIFSSYTAVVQHRCRTLRRNDDDDADVLSAAQRLFLPTSVKSSSHQRTVPSLPTDGAGIPTSD